jgi:hypothetical protein
LTLIEVLLALALSAIIMGMIAGTIRLHMNMLDTRRSGIDQAELARAILRQIRMDLEASVIPGAPPATPVTTDPVAAGLYGDLYQIRFDTSRSSRKLMQSVLDPTAVDLTLPASGFQTVSYTLGLGSQGQTPTAGGTAVSGTTAGGSGVATPATQPSGSGLSLIRTVLDQVVHSSMVKIGDPTLTQLFSQELAQEVNYLTFRYFDGEQWHEQWDTTLPPNGAADPTLPLAVEVTLGFDDVNQSSGTASAGVGATGGGSESGTTGAGGASITSLALNGASENTYQMIIKIPTSLLPLP